MSGTPGLHGARRARFSVPGGPLRSFAGRRETLPGVLHREHPQLEHPAGILSGRVGGTRPRALEVQREAAPRPSAVLSAYARDEMSLWTPQLPWPSSLPPVLPLFQRSPFTSRRAKSGRPIGRSTNSSSIENSWRRSAASSVLIPRRTAIAVSLSPAILCICWVRMPSSALCTNFRTKSGSPTPTSRPRSTTRFSPD